MRKEFNKNGPFLGGNRLAFYAAGLMVFSALWWLPSFLAQRQKLREVYSELLTAKDRNQRLNQEIVELAKMVDGLVDNSEEAAPSTENPLMSAVLAKTPSLAPALGPISSPFGYREHPIYRITKHHDGIDIAARKNAPVMAAADGEVMKTGYTPGLGKMVEIKHFAGLTTRYGHLNDILVKKGQKVKKGDLIGKVGSTGTATSAHLHFEVNFLGKALNPKEFMVEKPKKSQTI